MVKNQDWGKKATDAIAHINKGKSIKFTNSKRIEFSVKVVTYEELSGKFLEITPLCEGGEIMARPVENHEIDNYINGLFNPRQRRLTGDSEPVLVGAEPKKKAKVVASIKPKKPTKTNRIRLNIESIGWELKEKELPKPAKFKMFDIVTDEQKQVYVVTSIAYDFVINKFIFGCARSLTTFEEPTLFYGDEISHAKTR